MFKSFVVLASLALPFQSQAYDGSTFQELVDVIDGKNFIPKSQIEKDEYAVYQSGKLPQYSMNMRSVFGKGKNLALDAKRTISNKSDSFRRIEKLLHPNGVCVIGTWKITEPTSYTGYFSQGKTGLFIGRVSVAMEKTTAKSNRGFGFAGKIFPTSEVNTRVPTVNFFTVDILMGENTPHFLTTAMTNEPETGFNLSLIKFGLKISKALKLADQSPMFRPVSPISKIGLDSSPSKSPKWMRLSAEEGTILNQEADFRNEVLKASLENEKLKFKIEVSDTTKDRGANTGWTQIGAIEIDRAKVSYGCDRQLHFAHPKKDD